MDMSSFFVFGRKQRSFWLGIVQLKFAINSRSHLLIETILSMSIYHTPLKKNIFKINRKNAFER
jgi:hypothetical protein